MNGLAFFSGASAYLEIGQRFLRVSHQAALQEWTLERSSAGRLTEACKSRLKLELPAFLERPRWQPRLRAWCAIGARGVSLRRIRLPRSSKEDRHRLLLLQLESEFPVGLDELAWGYLSLDLKCHSTITGVQPASQDSAQELLVAAVKKEVLAEYTDLLAACGLQPTFTLSALARGLLCPPATGSHGVADLVEGDAELLCVDQMGPSSLRVIPWTAGAGPTEPAPFPNSPGDPPENPLQRSVNSLIQAVNRGIPPTAMGRTLYMSGSGARLPGLASTLTAGLGPGSACQHLDSDRQPSPSAAILGLRKAVETERNGSLLVLEGQTIPSSGRLAVHRPEPRKWAFVAGALALALVALPYVEALLLRPRLDRRLAALRTHQDRLTLIDRELGFLRHLRQNQPPYHDALLLLGKTVPPGSKLGALTMNRRGDLILRGSVRTPQEVFEFRSKLVDSGFFASVVVEEQTPSPDGQQVNFRISSQWKPASGRVNLPSLALENPSVATPPGPRP